MTKTGTVISTNHKLVTIETDNCTSCGSCNACSSGNNNKNTISFESEIELKVGDKVSFEFSDKTIFNISLLIYIFPLIFFFGGYFISSLFFKSEGIKILFSFISLTSSFLILYILDSRKSKSFKPQNITLL